MKELFKTSAKTKVERMLQESDYIPPVVVIKLEALLKMKAYVDISEIEFGWLCAVKRLEKENNFFLYDVFTCKQDISAVTTELHESGLQELAERLMKEGRGDELTNIRAWGHSHVDMPVYPSMQDNETFEEYYKNCDYFIRLILNKKGDIKIDIADTERLIIYYDTPWTVLYPDEMQRCMNQAGEILHQIEALQEKRNNILAPIEQEVDKMSEEYLALAKQEIGEYAVKEKEYKYDVRHGWQSFLNDDYDDEEEDFYRYAGYTKRYGTSKGYKDYGVQVKDEKSNILKYRSIEAILEEDVIYCCYGMMTEDLMEFLKKIPEFKYYNEKDWEVLGETINKYVDDEFEKER